MEKIFDYFLIRERTPEGYWNRDYKVNTSYKLKVGDTVRLSYKNRGHYETGEILEIYSEGVKLKHIYSNNIHYLKWIEDYDMYSRYIDEFMSKEEYFKKYGNKEFVLEIYPFLDFKYGINDKNFLKADRSYKDFYLYDKDKNIFEDKYYSNNDFWIDKLAIIKKFDNFKNVGALREEIKINTDDIQYRFVI